MRCGSSVVFPIIAVVGTCYAQNTIRVPADKATIQAAILSASNGDTVLVSPGTYRERIDFSKRAITVKSASGPDVTIIDGGQAGQVVSFVQGEGLSSVLQGFTIQNGTTSSPGLGDGGGISVSNSSPSILGNRIINNSACGSGGGIGVNFGAPLIQGNTISNNKTTCGGQGGAIGINGATADGARILGNIITGNSSTSDGGGVVLWASGKATLRDNVISGNEANGNGGGIAGVNSTPAIIVGNLIVGNTAGGAGGLSFSNPPASLINNTIAGNQSTNTTASAVSGMQTSFIPGIRIVGNLIIAVQGQAAVGCGVYGTSPMTWTFANNDIFTPGGGAYASPCVDQTGTNGNISADPLFVNPSSGNYRLQSTSPAINAGDPTATELGSTDLDGNPRTRSGKVDMGSYEYPGPATATLSSTLLSFPQQAVGTISSVQTITITNTGSAPLQFSSISITNDFSQTNTCPGGAGLAGGASCIIAVTFAPVGRGTRQGTLTIAANATASPWTVTLTGTAVGAVLNLSTNILNFPNEAVNMDSAPQQITASNTGDYPLTITAVTATAEFSQSNMCSAPVAVGATCQISVVFHPLASGTQTGTLTIASNAVGGAQTVNLAGNGVAPVPVLSSIAPSTATTYGAGFTLTVQGSNFIQNSVVRWNGSDRPTTFTSPTQLTAAIAASDLANGGLFPITVFNPAPGGGSSNPQTFTVANRVPTVTSLSPTSALVGGSNFQLTVNGSGFVQGSVVRWNGNDRPTTFVNPGQLRADISSTDISFASTSQLTVFNPAPGGGLSGSATFTALVPSPPPSLSSISPSSATAGDPAFTLMVSGSGFAATSIVQWNGSARPTTFVNDGQLQAAISAADVAEGGSVQIIVFNPPPGGGTSSSAVFTIAGNPLPILFSVTPPAILGGGTALTLTVTGRGFTAASTVQWNGANRPTTFVSVTQLTAMLLTSDTAVAGMAKVTVFNPPPGGGTSQALTVNVSANPVPVISSLLPSTLVAGSAGQALQINGTGFTSASVVRWNGQDRATTVINSATLSILLSSADLAAPGISEIEVYNPPLGGGSSSPIWFATTIALTANGLAYDKTHGLLYVSIPSSGGTLGNSVVSIDPMTGAIGSPIFVGSEPGKVVISDDGQYLYVALNAPGAVRRVDLAAQQADLQFSLGSDSFFGTRYVEDMDVMPGNPHTVAISRMYKGFSPRHAGVGIYDDGVIRQNTTPSTMISNRIEFGSSPSTIYGYNNETTPYSTSVLTVDANGVTETNVFTNSGIGFTADIKYNGGRIYSTGGTILNPDTGTLIGQFSLTAGNTSAYFYTGLGLAPDADLGRSFFLKGSFGDPTAILQTFDNSTFTLIGMLNIPGLTAAGSGEDVILRFGDDGLAVRGAAQIYFLRSSMVKPPVFSADSIQNAASYSSPPLVPGSLATLYGGGLTPLTLGAVATPLPTALGGVGITMNGSPVPLYYASPGQINFQVPWELAGQPNADIAVGVPGFSEKSVKVSLAPFSPGIFTTGASNGQAVAVIAGTSSLAAPSGALPGSRPVQRGEFLTFYGTGLGAVTNQPFTGSGSPADTPATTSMTPVVTIGGATANVTFSGLAPGFVGVYQINVQVPANAATGDAVPIVLSIGGSTSNTATIAVQ